MRNRIVDIYRKISFPLLLTAVGAQYWLIGALSSRQAKLNFELLTMDSNGSLPNGEAHRLIEMMRGGSTATVAAYAGLFILSLLIVSRPGFTRRQRISMIVLNLLVLLLSQAPVMV